MKSCTLGRLSLLYCPQGFYFGTLREADTQRCPPLTVCSNKSEYCSAAALNSSRSADAPRSRKLPICKQYVNYLRRVNHKRAVARNAKHLCLHPAVNVTVTTNTHVFFFFLLFCDLFNFSVLQSHMFYRNFCTLKKDVFH